MPGMMRTRSTGCTCCGDWGPDRSSDKRRWQHWLDEYETNPKIAVPDDECLRDHRPCPLDVTFCCTASHEES